VSLRTNPPRLRVSRARCTGRHWAARTGASTSIPKSLPRAGITMPSSASSRAAASAIVGNTFSPSCGGALIRKGGNRRKKKRQRGHSPNSQL
jgi:hypothetical protein